MVLAISQDNMMSWVALVQALSRSVRFKRLVCPTGLACRSECLPVQSGEEEMIKRVQVAEFSALYTSQSIAAVATYVHTCVTQKMSLQHIPEFVAALKGCLAQSDDTALSEQLHVAVTAMAYTVDLHLQLIDYIVAEARAHASPDTPAVVLIKMTKLRDTYLSTVSAQLLTSAQVDLQQVVFLLLVPVLECLDQVCVVVTPDTQPGTYDTTSQSISTAYQRIFISSITGLAACHMRSIWDHMPRPAPDTCTNKLHISYCDVHGWSNQHEI